MNIFYNYNRQIEPPAPLVNAIIRNPRVRDRLVNNPALIDIGASCSVVTPEIVSLLQPPRTGTIYIESYKGKGDFTALYRVDIEIHNWIFREVEVVVGDSHYAIIGRDILNHFDLRLNGIDGKLEFLRGPQSQIVF